MGLHKTVVWPDVHTPNHDKPSVKAALDFLRYYKPDRFIQLGDFCDWDSFTQYDPRRKEDIVNVETELDASNTLLDEIEAVLPKSCEKVLIGGNHEARVTKYMAKYGMDVQHQRVCKNFGGSWYNGYKLPKRGWSWEEYGKYRIYGKIAYYHGEYTGRTAAQRTLHDFGMNVIFGHTHMHLIAYGRDNILNDLPVFGTSIGTLSRFDLSYVNIPKGDWVRGFMYIDTRSSGRFTPHYTHIIDGKFIEHGREFDGRD